MGWLQELLNPTKTVQADGARALTMVTGYDQWSFTSFDESQTKMGDYLASNTGVYVCARYRAQLIASLPLNIYKKGTGKKRTQVTSGVLFDLLDTVNPFWTFGRLMEMSEYSMCLWGSNFWVLDRGGKGGEPKEIWWVRADKMKVVPDSKGYISHYEYDTGTGQPIRFNRDEAVWFRFPNPMNELSGLSPLMSSKIAADMANAATLSNAAIFKNGMQLSGIVSPGQDDATWTETQVKEITEGFRSRFGGVRNAHRVGVIPRKANIQSISLSPKDAEFLGIMNWSFADLCRAFGIPQDLLGGQRTYQNYKEARLSLWNDTLRPESTFIANELNEQLLPLFKNQADECAFDLSEVDVLQEVEDAKWDRAQDKLKAGALTINMWRSSQGEDPVPWGDVWWAPTAGGGVGPIVSGTPPIAPNQQIQLGGMTINELRETQGRKPVKWGDVWWSAPGTTPIEDAEVDPALDTTIAELPPPDTTKALKSGQTRAIVFGSEEHQRLWRAFTTQADKHEAEIAATTKRLMQNQRKSVLAKLSSGRSARDVAEEIQPFDKPSWVKRFREAIRPVLTLIVAEAGQDSLAALPNLELAFDVKNPDAIRFLEQRAQRFAVEVNDTTYEALQKSLTEGIDAGEHIEDLAKRVESVMGDRIRSSATTIARTEVIGAMNGANQLAWEQSGVVKGKEWLSALDERTRETHVEAHGQKRLLDEDFDVGSGSGPQPGDIGVASEDVNCRCTSVAILDVDWED